MSIVKYNPFFFPTPHIFAQHNAPFPTNCFWRMSHCELLPSSYGNKTDVTANGLTTQQSHLVKVHFKRALGMSSSYIWVLHPVASLLSHLQNFWGVACMKFVGRFFLSSWFHCLTWTSHSEVPRLLESVCWGCITIRNQFASTVVLKMLISWSLGCVSLASLWWHFILFVDS